MERKMIGKGTVLGLTLGLFYYSKINFPFDITFVQLKNIGMDLLAIIAILILSYFILKIGKKLITKFFDKQKELTSVPITDKRADTLKTITISILRYSIYFIVLTMILTKFGVNVSSLIAVAGVGGVAIGFGAQSLVKDVISGFFILLEDQYAVGDAITINTLTGTVKEIGLRTTKLKNFNGDIHIIPNGQISIVTNHTRSNKVAVVDVAVAHSENAEAVLNKLNLLCDELADTFKESIVEPPTVLGITEFKDNFYTIRITCTTLQVEQYTVERGIRLAVKNLFDKEGIISFNRPIIGIQKDFKNA